MRYFDQQDLFVEMIKRSSRIDGNVVVTNLLEEKTIFSGNRFIVYALYPEQNVDIRIMWGKEKQNIVIACGHSILNRSSQTNIGKLMLKHGGGGHDVVGTCQIPVETWQESLNDILETMKKDG